MEEKKSANFSKIFVVVLLMAASFFGGSLWTKNRYLEQESKRAKEEEKLAQASPNPQKPEVLGEQLESTVGGFLVTKNEVCKENGKPIVYMFGSSSCPHCKWEHPIFEKVVAKFKNQISLHDNMDKQGVDMDVYEKYGEINQGAIPFLLAGCKYARIGSGEQSGEATEEKNLTAILCKLTDGQPESICSGVKDLVGQVKD